MPEEAPALTRLPTRVWISRALPAGREQVLKLIARYDYTVHIDAGHTPAPDSLIVVPPLGVDATTTAVNEHLDATRVVAVDTLFPLETVTRRTIMTTPAMRAAAHALFAVDGVPVTVIRDSTGSSRSAWWRPSSTSAAISRSKASRRRKTSISR